MTSLKLTDPPELTAIRIRPSFVVQVCGWLAAALLTYGAMSARVAVVESKQLDMERRMERIESKIDLLLQRGDR